MITIELKVSDENLAKKVLQVCKMIMGVTSVKVKKETLSKSKLYDPETGKYLNEKSITAIEDAMNGNGVTQYDSLGDFYKEMGI